MTGPRVVEDSLWDLHQAVWAQIQNLKMLQMKYRNVTDTFSLRFVILSLNYYFLLLFSPRTVLCSLVFLFQFKLYSVQTGCGSALFIYTWYHAWSIWSTQAFCRTHTSVLLVSKLLCRSSGAFSGPEKHIVQVWLLSLLDFCLVNCLTLEQWI